MERRIREAEAVTKINVEERRYLDHAYRLCEESPLLTAIRIAARAKGRRRALQEGRYPISGLIPRDDDEAWIEAELIDLHQCMGVAPAEGEPLDKIFAVIKAWCNEPDDLGWLRPYTGSSHIETDYKAFLHTLKARRQVTDGNRMSAAAAGWRANNPLWRFGMPDDEYWAWDLTRMFRPKVKGAHHARS